jgi:integrase
VENVSASTQDKTLNAILFLYRDVLKRDPSYFGDFVRAKKPKHLPTVFSRDEVIRLFANMRSQHQLPVKILYGAGMIGLLLGRSD